MESKLRVLCPDSKVEIPLGLNEARPDDEATLYTPTLGLRPKESPKEAPTTRTKGGREYILEREGQLWLPLCAGTTYAAKVVEVRDGNSPLQPDKLVLSVGPKLTFPKVEVGDVLQLAMETRPALDGVQTALARAESWLRAASCPISAPRISPGTRDR